jgi:hypothetical protein
LRLRQCAIDALREVAIVWHRRQSSAPQLAAMTCAILSSAMLARGLAPAHFAVSTTLDFLAPPE